MKIPEPDLAATPRVASEYKVVETVYAEDKQIRVSILADENNLLRIHTERWDVSDLDVIGEAFWMPWGHSVSFTDDINIARDMIAESFRITPRSTVIPDNQD
jgi:hypothetical protein